MSHQSEEQWVEIKTCKGCGAAVYQMGITFKSPDCTCGLWFVRDMDTEREDRFDE
jgi:hypothetical protein